MPPTAKLFQFSKLASADAKPFDGMAAGDFVDMYGRPVSIKRDELAAYVINTKRNIEATKDADGNVIGLPIDCMNHDHQQAAGWIVDVNLAEGRDVIQFTPRWNETGTGLIGSDLMRMFSAEFDPKAKAIIGGSLTNWPATRTREQKILLQPIALSQSLSSISIDESLDERVRSIRGAFNEFTGSWYVWAVEVFDGYLICRDDDEDKMYRVDYTDGENGLAFADRSAWVEVKQTYIEAAIQAAKNILDRVFSGLTGRRDEPTAKNKPGETQDPEDQMTDVSKLTPEQRQSLLAQLTSGSEPIPELAALVKQQATEMAAAMLAAEQRKVNTLALASRLVGGTAEHPRGLPVEKDQLADFLLSLSPEQAEKATTILSTIQEKGVVDFNELGHAGKVEGKHDLPAEYALALDQGKLSLEDLSNPVLGLGNLAEYNLSKWQKEK